MTDPWTLFAAVALAHALGVASPGPDFAVVMRQTLAHGRTGGVLTACGIGSGIVFHVAWGMFGLGWAVENLPGLLPLLRYGGAAFLLWMGVQALRTRPAQTTDPLTAHLNKRGAWRHYGIGLATNLLNVKALLFFVALCSSVITVDTPVWLRLGLSLWLVLATVAWFSFLACTVGHPALRRRLGAISHHIDHAMGLVLIALALAVLLNARMGGAETAMLTP
ncbi:LysE family transporter [Panacagrimonas sp.]|uniref:LysE family transporter n=1 Tax=Panacagrimonas sp. TaxID=2480088 RepID=UPI003B5231AA